MYITHEKQFFVQQLLLYSICDPLLLWLFIATTWKYFEIFGHLYQTYAERVCERHCLYVCVYWDNRVTSVKKGSQKLCHFHIQWWKLTLSACHHYVYRYALLLKLTSYYIEGHWCIVFKTIGTHPYPSPSPEKNGVQKRGSCIELYFKISKYFTVPSTLYENIEMWSKYHEKSCPISQWSLWLV